MLSQVEELKLIRQAEMNNLSESEEESLKNWGIQARTNFIFLELMFDGYVEINAMVGEPSFTLTPAGIAFVGSTNIDDLIEMCDFDPDDEIYDDFDEDEEFDEVDEAIMALGNTAEEVKHKMQVLQTLSKRLDIESE